MADEQKAGVGERATATARNKAFHEIAWWLHGELGTIHFDKALFVVKAVVARYDERRKHFENYKPRKRKAAPPQPTEGE